MKRHEALKKLHQESTIDFWEAQESSPGWNMLLADQKCVCLMACGGNNAKFLVEAANEAPGLIDDVKVLAEALQELEDEGWIQHIEDSAASMGKHPAAARLRATASKARAALNRVKD